MMEQSTPYPANSAPKPWESIGLVFVQMLTLLILAIAFGVLNGLLPVGANGLLIFTLLGEIFLVVPLMVWVAIRGFSWKKTFRWQSTSWKMILLAAGLGVTVWPLASAVSLPFEWILSQIGPAPEFPAPENLFQAIIFGVTVMLVAPVVEEPMFRGFVLRGWQSVGSWAAILVTGVLFGLLHGQLAQLPALTLVGILLGIIVLRSGSIIPGLILHGVFNALGFFSLINATWITSIPDTTVLLVSTVVLPLFIILLMRLMRHPRAAVPAISMPDDVGWLLVALGSLGVMGLFGIFAMLDIANRMLSPFLGGF